MNKQKNRSSEKRREARKRIKALKRKAQVRSKSLGNIQTQHPLENISARKLSEVVLEFAEPLTNAVEGTEDEEKAINMSILFWNASLLPNHEALDAMKPALDDIAKGDQTLKSEFHSMFSMMYDRKQKHYATDRRYIVDYSLEKNREGYYLQVASTPFKA